MPNFLTPYLFWIKLVGFLLALAAAAGAATYITHNADTVVLQKVQLDDSKAQTASISASLSQLQSFIANIHTADTGYQADLDAIKDQFALLKKELHDATLKPLPADCRPDAGRLRVLTDAVASANKRASTGK